MKLARTDSGFTLIELSIVLVIIGLIVGVVLVGRDLIHAAEIRKIVTQRDQFEAAANTFKGKYNCLPGDCNHAVAVGVGVSGDVYGDDGDGDGKIGFNQNTSLNEMANFWYHLSKANLINWKFDPNYTDEFAYNVACYDPNAPAYSSPCMDGFSSANGIKGGWWIWSASVCPYCPDYPQITVTDANYWWLGANLTSYADNNISSDDAAIFTPADAYAIDVKIDDGLPTSGSVLAVDDHLGNDNYIPYPSTHNCTNTAVTPNVYNVKDANHTGADMCGLVIKAGF